VVIDTKDPQATSFRFGQPLNAKAYINAGVPVTDEAKDCKEDVRKITGDVSPIISAKPINRPFILPLA
jgi:hypothetical protein